MALVHVTLQVFVNVATGGFGTELTLKTDEEMKKTLGGAAYAITGAGRCCGSAVMGLCGMPTDGLGGAVGASACFTSCAIA